jgi:hypothetical protein
MLSGMVKAMPAMAGSSLGTAMGGPMGGMAGSAIGGQIGQGLSKDQGALNVSNPVARRMETLKADPLETLRQGKAQLAGMDDQTKAALEPVLDEALKRAATNKQGM